MTGLAVAAVVLAVFWALDAVMALRQSATGASIGCAVLSATHLVAACWAPAAPLTLAAWFGYALTLPDGHSMSRARRAVLAVIGTGALCWTVVLAAQRVSPSTPLFLATAAVLAVVCVIAVVLRCRRCAEQQRRTIQWLAAAAALWAGFAVVVATLHLTIGAPGSVLPFVATALVAFPIGQLAALFARTGRSAVLALTQSIAIAGVAVLVSLVYLVIVVGINGVPEGDGRGVLVSSLAAAVIVAVLAVPVRDRLVGLATAFVGNRRPSTEEVATGFGARMSRAVPMDELLLQLAESLRGTSSGARAEIWTGLQGLLNRVVSVPEREPAHLVLGSRERVIVGQARIGGAGWIGVWLPSLLEPVGPQSSPGDLRVAPIAHLGELFGLIVLRRPEEAPAFTDADERALVDVARQLGSALNNVRLDSALQASLVELAERNDELQASRLRIVTAANASRRAIERNLHDGAQQHLVAMAVKLGLARQIAQDGELDVVLELLAELRGDVQTTITELRELAHGIYPPLLRDRGLGEALTTAARRSALPCTVDVDLPGRFAEEVETAIYFCCLEAIQNAGKYAGDGATITVRVGCDEANLTACLIDDGAGFDVGAGPLGHGFTNMADRLGALGGELSVESRPGAGTTVRLRIPARTNTPAPVGRGTRIT